MERGFHGDGQRHGLRLAQFSFSDRNFGDALNAWLLPRLAPGLFDQDGADMMWGIGSIIGDAAAPAREIVVYSAGAGYGPVHGIAKDARLRVACVRGPLTAAVLGVDPRLGQGDAGMLAAPFASPPARRTRIALAPHWESLTSPDWAIIAEECGFDLIDMRDPVDRILAQLSRARLVLAEALHAAILADALDTPWAPFVSNGQINRFKWADWTSAMHTAYRPVILPPPHDLEARFGFARAPVGAASPYTSDMALRDFRRLTSPGGQVSARWARKWRKARAKHAHTRALPASVTRARRRGALKSRCARCCATPLSIPAC
jgi:hypothetical protein